jgi:hypothetical protein
MRLFLSKEWKRLRIRIGSVASNAVYQETNQRPKKVWREIDGQYMEIGTYPPDILHCLDAALRHILGEPDVSDAV